MLIVFCIVDAAVTTTPTPPIIINNATFNSISNNTNINATVTLNCSGSGFTVFVLSATLRTANYMYSGNLSSSSCDVTRWSRDSCSGMSDGKCVLSVRQLMDGNKCSEVFARNFTASVNYSCIPGRLTVQQIIA